MTAKMEQAEGERPLVDKADSFRTWCDAIRDRFVALRIAPHSAPDLGGSITWRRVGPLQAAAVVSAPQTFTRTKRQADTADETPLLAVGMVESGTGYLEQDGRRCEVSNGGFAVYETSRPFTWTMTGDWRLCVYTWARGSVVIPEAQTQRITAINVERAAGLGLFLGPMLSQLIRTDAGLSPQGAMTLANEVAEMSVLAAGETHTGEQVDGGADKVGEIQRFIEQHIGDSTLTPDAIAREFYMSTRSLHRLFAQSGLTVGSWIKHRRLEACRRALTSPGSRAVPINEIAGRYGFTNQAFFSREFAAQYHLSPRKYRESGLN
jgi:AraC-like DNA-binding protein